MAVIRQEANKRYMWLSVIWSLVIAYGVAVGFYQVANLIAASSWNSMTWIVGLFGLVFMLGLIRRYSKRIGGRNVIANS